MRKLVLIKHASPLVVPGTPPERWQLSDKGRESCAALAEAVRPHAPGVIVASEEPKATETAELVAQALAVPVETAPGLHEHDRSNVPHMRPGEFISHVELFFRRPRELVLGRESAEQCAQRFEQAVDAVLSRHAEQSVAIVTHGTVLALFVARHGDRKPFELWRELGLPSLVVMSLPDRRVETVVPRIA
ncbi:MAG TPA: histidine phosphatase family protein [Tepidisphaeraceae bacterium]|nr:histidine phosphatase family protein [Tepidisphaeraceae bacterium]